MRSRRFSSRADLQCVPVMRVVWPGLQTISGSVIVGFAGVLRSRLHMTLPGSDWHPGNQIIGVRSTPCHQAPGLPCGHANVQTGGLGFRGFHNFVGLPKRFGISLRWPFGKHWYPDFVRKGSSIEPSPEVVATSSVRQRGSRQNGDCRWRNCRLWQRPGGSD